MSSYGRKRLCLPYISFAGITFATYNVTLSLLMGDWRLHILGDKLSKLLMMMMKPVILFKNIYLKVAKALQENMGKPLMTNSEHFLE